MPLTEPSPAKRSILAIIVLYKRSPSDSEALGSLAEAFRAVPELTRSFSLLVYDNSPQPHGTMIQAEFPIYYRHDPANSGLATAYNYALVLAEQTTHEWLLLLDQDTSLTPGFFEELITCREEMTKVRDVASIVPKLIVKDTIHSPAPDFIEQLRHPFRRARHAIDPGLSGIQAGQLGAYNSGATLRVSALRAIAGFPEDYWLDYLDHAVFHALLRRGYRMYVMQTTLKHDLQHANLNSVPSWRLRNILLAQALFVRRSGNVADHLLYRLWLLRYARALWRFSDDRRMWKEAAAQALIRKLPKNAMRLGPPAEPPDGPD